MIEADGQTLVAIDRVAGKVKGRGPPPAAPKAAENSC